MPRDERPSFPPRDEPHVSARRRIVVVGAGGQARDIAWLVRELDRAGAGLELVGFVVTDTARLGPHDSEVLGDYAALDRVRPDALALGIGAPRARLKVAADLAARFPHDEDHWPALVHPSVVIDRESLHLAPGTSLCAGSVGSVNVTLEPFALVNIGITLGHEARIGEGSVVNHGASISGGVVLERGVLVGTGARVLQYLTVHEGATVGAGAVVTRDVAAGTTVVGIPARARTC